MKLFICSYHFSSVEFVHSELYSDSVHSLQVNVLWMINKKNIYNANVINVLLAGSKKQYFSTLNREHL